MMMWLSQGGWGALGGCGRGAAARALTIESRGRVFARCRCLVCVCACVDRSISIDLSTIDQPSNHPEHTTQLLLIDIYVYKIIVARSIEISPDSLTHIDRALLFDRSTDGIHLHQRTIRRRWIGPHQSTRLVSIALLRRWYLYVLSTEWISTRGHLPVSLDIDPNTRDSLSLSLDSLDSLLLIASMRSYDGFEFGWFLTFFVCLTNATLSFLQRNLAEKPMLQPNLGDDVEPLSDASSDQLVLPAPSRRYLSASIHLSSHPPVSLLIDSVRT